ncbi:trichohyalin-like [Ischnura elegans]|uniref:trichohyalin-like n=1 Tax=Ischnura elegans TaxID=197161 RepID=UPI001ED8BD07|nr:trichohyalin-like [Ischnura elegans]
MEAGTKTPLVKDGEETKVNSQDAVELLDRSDTIERERRLRADERVMIERQYITINNLLEMVYKMIDEAREERRARYDMDEKERDRRAKEAMEWDEQRRKEIKETAKKLEEEYRKREEDLRKREEEMKEDVAEAKREVERMKEKARQEIMEREKEIKEMAEKRSRELDEKEKRVTEEVRKKEEMVREKERRIREEEEKVKKEQHRIWEEEEKKAEEREAKRREREAEEMRRVEEERLKREEAMKEETKERKKRMDMEEEKRREKMEKEEKDRRKRMDMEEEKRREKMEEEEKERRDRMDIEEEKRREKMADEEKAWRRRMDGEEQEMKKKRAVEEKAWRRRQEEEECDRRRQEEERRELENSEKASRVREFKEEIARRRVHLKDAVTKARKDGEGSKEALMREEALWREETLRTVVRMMHEETDGEKRRLDEWTKQTMEGEGESGGIESARTKEDKDAMLFMKIVIKEQVDEALKREKEELKMKSGYLERKEEDIRRIVEDLESRKTQVEEMMKRMEELYRLEMKTKGTDIGDTRKRDSKAEKESRGQENISKTVDQKMRDELIQNEVMGKMQNVEEELEEERASMEKETEGLERDEELWRQTVRKAIADGMRKERLIVEEEVRRSVEEELNGKWRKRVEEVESWWKTQNSALKGEWECERVELEREQKRNVKELEEMRLKLVEAERLRIQLEEKNKRLTSEAEFPGEEWSMKTEEEIEGKWRKRVEEVDSWWKTQNSELKGEWENEKMEWEREKAKNVKDMEELRLKLVEAESLSMQLEEKNRRLKSDAELQREEWKRETEKNRRDWMEEKNNMTRKWEEKLKKDVDEAKEAGRMEMEETFNNMHENYGREIKTLKEDVEMKEKGLYELQRKLDAISSKYEDEKYELNNKYQIEIIKLKKQNYDTKNVLNSKINEVDAKEKEFSMQLKELNELQRWTVSEVRRFAGYRTEYYSQLATQQRPKHSDALDTRVVSYSHNVRQGMSGDTCDSWNARQKAVERKEKFIGELERKWIEYVHQVSGKLEDFGKSGECAGKSKTKIFTNAYSKRISLFSFMSDVASAVVGSVEEHEDLTNSRKVYDAFNQDDAKVLSFSNGKGQGSEKYRMQDLSNHREQLNGSKYDPLAGIKCSARGQGDDVKNTDQEVDMNVACGDLCRDVVKKEVKSANHGKEDFEVAIGSRTCESASVNGKNSHVGNDSDSSQDWLVVTERELDDKFNESISKIKDKCDQKMMEMRKQIEKHDSEMMKLRKEMERMRETNRQCQLQSNDQSSELLTSNEGNVFREGGEELGGDELKDRKYR